MSMCVTAPESEIHALVDEDWLPDRCSWRTEQDFRRLISSQLCEVHLPVQPLRFLHAI